MCGVVGRVNANRAVDAGQLSKAASLMAHRGPDGEGVCFGKNAGLAHRRLAIIDREGGAQPMCNEDRTVWVTYNGEIYNHSFLREELKALGHRFVSRADTEVLVHGYEEWGERLPEHLRGMFAFGVWDGRKERLLLARDRLGIKPLYWTLVGADPGDLIFASEIKALLAFPDLKQNLNSVRLAEYFALRYVPGPNTLFSSIYRLQPGNLLVFENGKIKISQYWDVPVEAAIEDLRKYSLVEESEAFLQELLESVRMRLMAEVPVGVFLSGGIDSSAVAWAMKHAAPETLKSFSIGFEGDSEGELAYAKIASEALGTEHREITLDSAQFLNSLPKAIWHLDEPLSDGACIPLMHLAKRAREEVVVVLSGEGADEILGGYQIYQKMIAIEKLRALGAVRFKSLFNKVEQLNWRPKIARYIGLTQKPLESRYRGVGRGFDDKLIWRAFGPRALEDLDRRNGRLWQRTEGECPLNRMLYLDTKMWLPDDLLIKADKMTMAWSIELRVPFLDHELLTSAWCLPRDLKLQGATGKRILKCSMAGRLPKRIINRPKKGFPLPLNRWLKGALHEPCRERILASGSACRGLFGSKLLRALLEEHLGGKLDRSEELFALWVFEEWHEMFLGSRAGIRAKANTIKRDVMDRPADLNLGI